MTRSTLIRRACLALAAFTLACGDSTGPTANLTQEQVTDMLDAMSTVVPAAPVPGVSLSVVNFTQTVSCPNGGSASVDATVNEDKEAGTATVSVTQGFTGCMATSKKGRVWTFDGDPNIVTNLSLSYNQTTGAFSITGSRVGGIKVASDLGSRSCAINLTFTLTGEPGSIAGSLSGSACGHDIEQTISVTE
jgi:hypothetical protein